MRWTFVSVGHQLDIRWTFVTFGHLIKTCWTLAGHPLDFCVFWTWDGHQLDIRCRTLAGANKGHCWRESDQWAGVCQFWEVAMTWAAATAPGAGEGGHQEHQLYSEQLGYSEVFWADSREYHCWWWWTSTLLRKDSALQLTWVLWSALNLPRLILIPSTPRALLTALNVWSAVKSEWLAIGVGNVLQWKVHSRHWHPALFLVKIHSAKNLLFRIQSDENLLVKIQIQLSYTFKEKVFFDKISLCQKIFHISVKLRSV